MRDAANVHHASSFTARALIEALRRQDVAAVAHHLHTSRPCDNDDHDAGISAAAADGSPTNRLRACPRHPPKLQQLRVLLRTGTSIADQWAVLQLLLNQVTQTATDEHLDDRLRKRLGLDVSYLFAPIASALETALIEHIVRFPYRATGTIRERAHQLFAVVHLELFAMLVVPPQHFHHFVAQQRAVAEAAAATGSGTFEDAAVAPCMCFTAEEGVSPSLQPVDREAELEVMDYHAFLFSTLAEAAFGICDITHYVNSDRNPDWAPRHHDAADTVHFCEVPFEASLPPDFARRPRPQLRSLRDNDQVRAAAGSLLGQLIALGYRPPLYLLWALADSPAPRIVIPLVHALVHAGLELGRLERCADELSRCTTDSVLHRVGGLGALWEAAGGDDDPVQELLPVATSGSPTSPLLGGQAVLALRAALQLSPLSIVELRGEVVGAARLLLGRLRLSLSPASRVVVADESSTRMFAASVLLAKLLPRDVVGVVRDFATPQTTWAAIVRATTMLALLPEIGADVEAAAATNVASSFRPW